MSHKIFIIDTAFSHKPETSILSVRPPVLIFIIIKFGWSILNSQNAITLITGNTSCSIFTSIPLDSLNRRRYLISKSYDIFTALDLVLRVSHLPRS